MAETPKADPDIRIRREDSLIKMVFEPTAKGAHIAEVVPFTLNDPEYPALLVLWVVDLGGTKVPLQVLTYDHETKTYIDGTEEVFQGRVPKADNPRAASIFGTDKGLGIVIANTGLDRAPFSRATNTLILPTGDGHLKDASRMLPQDLQFSHDVSTGVINERGDIGIYINSMYVPEYFIMRGEKLIDASADYLPNAIHRDDKKFTASELADVNGDGFADLILGSSDEHNWRSVIYLNNGSGRFDRGGPSELPRTPFPERKLQFVDRTVGGTVVDIQRMKLDEAQPYDDLLVTSNDAYMGYATQILRNDGHGEFTDVTAQLIQGDAKSYFNNTSKPYTWQLRAIVFDHGSGPDILTKSEARFEVPSYVFGNNGDGTFGVDASVVGSAITNAGSFGGTNMLIRLVDSTDIVLTDYPAH
ncbi:MAG: repeat-containing protein [Devosia sp.]|uniref:FG-GAP repeat domain-containing protein n=1 Tax=Devosia sp. TaxID=1871048 RepID=UPI0026201890|nr:VCBS repeat-containing protein [Devosia sp.]MDB5585913.1 repeat-containing protein [Devosia sp.]